MSHLPWHRTVCHLSWQSASLGKLLCTVSPCGSNRQEVCPASQDWKLMLAESIITARFRAGARTSPLGCCPSSDRTLLWGLTDKNNIWKTYFMGTSCLKVTPLRQRHLIPKPMSSEIQGEADGLGKRTILKLHSQITSTCSTWRQNKLSFRVSRNLGCFPERRASNSILYLSH